MSKEYPKFSDQSFAREIAALSKTNQLTKKTFERINAGDEPCEVLDELKRNHLHEGQIDIDLSHAFFLLSEIKDCSEKVRNESIDLSILTSESLN